MPWAHAALALAMASVSPVSAAAAEVDAGLEAAVRKHLHVFLTVPERREAGEGLSLDGHGELEIRVLRSLPDAQRAAWLCQGMRWLLLGRLSTADGAAGLFRERDDVEAVVLVLYTLETQLSLDAQGRYRQTRTARPQARLRLTRDRALSLDRAHVEAELGPGECVANGEALLDAVWAPKAPKAPAAKPPASTPMSPGTSATPAAEPADGATEP